MTDDDDDRRKRILEIVARVSGRDADGIEPSHNLAGDLGIDSPRALELLCEMEDYLGVEIPDEAAARIHTVQDLLDHA